MEVTYTLDPGPVEHFGPLAITGLERLDPGYVEGGFAGSPARSMTRPRSKRPAVR